MSNHDAVNFILYFSLLSQCAEQVMMSGSTEIRIDHCLKLLSTSHPLIFSISTHPDHVWCDHIALTITGKGQGNLGAAVLGEEEMLEVLNEV